MADIGERAAKAIYLRALQNGTKKGEEYEKIGASRRVIFGWKKQNLEPSAYFLQQMALHGYDVYWILTGKESL